ncbi:DUF354 domain-containing protein [Arthrospiribacter ruber]|uniref:DUF354 domain-containing protein n=1 Tax=Arthrospiribacter ruber TaxID=2487934 RepID=A0A951IY79_9BACT|nr:DUF354 domain-containing protein [Arthrospiribacter ruber]MBW3468304.1 DUF354 domain-containing protein [Arthrospiribacter ruber]
MVIWIDFINTPQVNFFEPFIKDLEKRGHHFVLTCRDSSNTVPLLKTKGWPFTIIGEKVHKSFFTKVFGFPTRIINLRKFLKDKNVDVAIGQSSFYLPITARSLGIKSIYTNDNEHAMGNIPSFLFANKILLPENFSLKTAYAQGASKKKISQYPGVKEGIYLWEKGLKIQELRINSIQDHIYLRPEPNTAQYYSGEKNFLDEVINSLKKDYKVFVLVRDADQRKHYQSEKFQGVTVPEKALNFEKIAQNCLLFIGAGGSMTREMAIMGVPTISVYQGELLNVDKTLIQNGLMRHQEKISFEEVKDLINNIENSQKNPSIYLEKGRAAFNLIKNTIFNIN